MIEWKSLLQKSIQTANDGFMRAESELTAVVEELSSELKETAHRDFRLIMFPVSENMKYSVFQVSLDTDENKDDADAIKICYFKISSKGFPIEEGAYRKQIEQWTPTSQMKSREDIENFFKEMIGNPDSSFVQAIGFAIRQKKGE